MIADLKEMQLAAYGDARGLLIPLEADSSVVPFEIKRVYYIFNTSPGTTRGMHAHRELKQLLVCVSGACTIDCELPDGTKSSHRLDCPTKALLIGGLVWHEMRDFSEGDVLMVLASDRYDENDYIRDKDVFLKEAQEFVHSRSVK